MKSRLLSLIKNKKIKKIITKYDGLGADKELFKYNIFSLSKLGTHLEDFHSDIIYSLLNPKGLHKEKTNFLFKFIEYLNTNYSNKIKLNDFKNAEVYRELGRLDISIIDYSSKSAIIFENKINNAPDMKDQLDRYFEWCKKKDLKVVGIVYLSLRGLKNAPLMKNNADVFNIGAFSNSKNDIVNGWLTPCIGSSKKIENTGLIIQYKKLLTYLGYKSMETDTLEEFYKLLDKENLTETINKLKELSDKIPEYRTDKFIKTIVDYKPFNKTYRYRSNHMFYENFIEGDNKFKIDIVFKENGSAFLYFWNPNKSGKEAFLSLENKLREINYLENFPKQKIDDLDENSWVGFQKYFDIEFYGKMEKIDDEIVKFTKDFMSRLK